MLKFFRNKRIAKIIFWGLVILILPAFVLWGSGSMSRSRGKGPTYVGMVAGKKISFEDLLESMTAIRSQLVLNYFGQTQILDTFLTNRPLIAKLAWDRIIMLREAKRQKIKISDRDVIAYVRSHPIFIRNGSFDSRVYNYALRYSMGLTPRTFEEVVRENLAIMRLQDMLTKEISMSDEEVLNEYKKENERFKISYILIETKAFSDKVTVDDAAISQYYETHKSEFVVAGKEGGKASALAKLEDVKLSIRAYLAQEEAMALALKEADGLHAKIAGWMAKGGSFEDAAARSGMKASESAFFARSDYIEGIGEAGPVVDAALLLRSGEISKPLRVRAGVLIFRIAGSQGIDENKFKEEREAFAKKALNKKKGEVLDRWFSTLYLKTNLKIDLEDVEKYYR